MGFEPTVRFRITSFQDWLHKPLGHLSMFLEYIILKRQSQVNSVQILKSEKKACNFLTLDYTVWEERGRILVEMKRIDPQALHISQIVSLVDIARGISPAAPEWTALQQKLTRLDCWGFYDRGELVGYALADGKSPYCGGSVRLAELKYRWQYNGERDISWMLCQLAMAYRLSQKWMVMDVDLRREINLELYQKLGFQPSVMGSPLGRENVVMVCPLELLTRI